MADYLLDTNVLILHLRDHPELTALLTAWSETCVLNISMVTRTEVLAGMHPHEEKRTMELLDSLTSLVVDALQHDLTLVTSNAKHFPIPELRLYAPE